MERRHINFGPGRIYGPDGKTLFDIQEASFEDITTTPAPGPAGDVRFPLPSFLEPIELSLDIKTNRRLLAALLVGWRTNGPARWIALKRARQLAKNTKRRPRPEVRR